MIWPSDEILMLYSTNYIYWTYYIYFLKFYELFKRSEQDGKYTYRKL